jgi:AI-2 transport protein TqsA
MTGARGRVVVGLLGVIVALLSAAALRATYFVTMPLAFAFFVAVLVWPLHEGLGRRLPARLEWLATVATMLVVVLVLGGFLALAVFVVYGVALERGRELFAGVEGRWEALGDALERRGLPSLDEGATEQLVAGLAGWAGATAMSVTGLLTVLILIVFFTLLMLVEARHWKEKSRSALPRARMVKIMTAISAQVRTFILVQTFIAAVTATATGLWLWAMGVPLVLLWTLLTFLADFVPNAGPTFAGIAVSLVALATLGWERALLTAAGILLIQQFFGNFVDPALKGRRMSISPVVVLLSVVFWAWVWGPIGAVLAVPMTATIIVACGHVPGLRPVALLLHHTADEQDLDDQVGTS